MTELLKADSETITPEIKAIWKAWRKATMSRTAAVKHYGRQAVEELVAGNATHANPAYRDDMRHCEACNHLYDAIEYVDSVVEGEFHCEFCCREHRLLEAQSVEFTRAAQLFELLKETQMKNQNVFFLYIDLSAEELAGRLTDIMPAQRAGIRVAFTASHWTMGELGGLTESQARSEARQFAIGAGSLARHWALTKLTNRTESLVERFRI